MLDAIDFAMTATQSFINQNYTAIFMGGLGIMWGGLFMSGKKSD